MKPIHLFFFFFFILLLSSKLVPCTSLEATNCSSFHHSLVRQEQLQVDPKTTSQLNLEPARGGLKRRIRLEGDEYRGEKTHKGKGTTGGAYETRRPKKSKSAALSLTLFASLCSITITIASSALLVP